MIPSCVEIFRKDTWLAFPGKKKRPDTELHKRLKSPFGKKKDKYPARTITANR